MKQDLDKFCKDIQFFQIQKVLNKKLFSIVFIFLNVMEFSLWTSKHEENRNLSIALNELFRFGSL